MGNGIDTAVAMMGAYAARLQIAPLNPAYTDPELSRLIADVEPAAIACSPELAERVGSLAGGTGKPDILAVGVGDLDVWRWTEDESLSLPTDRPRPDDRCIMFFTGGTTGVPKGAEHVHGSYDWFCRQTHAMWRFGFDRETILNVAPMFHIWGHHFSRRLPALHPGDRGDRAALPPGPGDRGAGAPAGQRVRRRPRGDLSRPAWVGRDGRCGSRRAEIQPSRRLALPGGPAGALEGADRQRDTGRASACRRARRSASTRHTGPGKRLSVGPRPPDTDLEIVDLESGTRVLPTGERGEIRVRGPQFTIGYRGRAEDTAEAIRDGWLYTGDIGYLDEDGYLFLVDRKKELILVGGYNVYPREVDEAMTNHPAVAEAAAVGMRGRFSGRGGLRVRRPATRRVGRGGRPAKACRGQPREVQAAKSSSAFSRRCPRRARERSTSSP